MERTAHELGIRCSGMGIDLYKHEYREDNTRADELTHLAREGHCFYNQYEYRFNFESYLQPIACRGAFDGGVCSK
eukprot:1271090-Pyramimonas_sp.AAC.1